MGSLETRSSFAEGYKNLNQLTLVGALGVAAIAAVTPGLQGLVVPALGLAAIDAGQIVVINHFNKKKTQ